MRKSENSLPVSETAWDILQAATLFNKEYPGWIPRQFHQDLFLEEASQGQDLTPTGEEIFAALHGGVVDIRLQDDAKDRRLARNKFLKLLAQLKSNLDDIDNGVAIQVNQEAV